MTKKKRARKITVYGCIEGKREGIFLTFLVEVYRPDENNINLYSKCSFGGKPDHIVKTALDKCDRDKSFAWLDEDFEPDNPLGKEIREKLMQCWCIKEEQKISFFSCPMRKLQQEYNPKNKNPVLIISQPICVESVILQVLGHKLPYTQYNTQQRETQIKGLKDKLNKLIGKKDEIVFYRENLSKKKIEEMRKTILELNLLILMITN